MIYVLGLILSAFSMKGFAATQMPSSCEETHPQKTIITLNLRTPEYLKNEYN